GFSFAVDGDQAAVRMVDGQPGPGPVADGLGIIRLDGPHPVWDAMLQPEPPRFFNDIGFATALGLELRADPVTFWQYYPAITRALELMRPRPPVTTPTRSSRRFDSPVGRYVHVELDGRDHRIYFEEAGAGIPLLLQHTAGSHGVQWRHLF